MDWQFTMERQDLSRQLSAMAKHKGTTMRRRVMRERVFLLVMMAVLTAVLPFFYGDAWDATAGEKLQFFVIMLVTMLAFVALPIWVLTPWLAVQHEMMLYMISGQLNEQLGPRRVTVDETAYTIAARTLSGRDASVRRAVSTVQAVTTSAAGMMVWFADGTADFVPLRAFNASRGQGLIDCRKALLAAAQKAKETFAPAEAAQQSPPEIKAADPGLFETPQGVLALRYTFPADPQAVGDIFAEAFTALYCSPEYWLSQWKTGALLLALLAAGIAAKLWVVWAIPVLAVVMMVVKVLIQPFTTRRRAQKGQFATFCGPQTVYLEQDCLSVVRPQNDSTLPYENVHSVYETEHTLFLLQKWPRAVLPIPRMAFLTEEQRERFITTLQNKLEQAQGE